MSNILQIDDRLLAVLTKATRDGLAMGEMKPLPVSISSQFLCPREVTAIIGCVGHLSGSICVNCTPAGAIFMTNKMLQEEHTEMDEAVLDGVCEIANIIGGQVKALLSSTEYKFEKISLPAVVVGSNYTVAHGNGALNLSIDFELKDVPSATGKPMTFTVAMFLMKV